MADQTCAVCGMHINEGHAVTEERNGVTHQFCSEGCRDAFLNDQGASDQMGGMIS